MSLSDEYRLLAQVPPFGVLDQRQLKLLSFVSQRLRFAPGQTLCRQGDVADGVFVIVDGEVAVTIASGGQQQAVRRMGQHAFVGEIGALALSRRTATVTAETPVTALKLDQAQFQRLLTDIPALKKAVEEHIEKAHYVYD